MIYDDEKLNPQIYEKMAKEYSINELEIVDGDFNLEFGEIIPDAE